MSYEHSVECSCGAIILISFHAVAEKLTCFKCNKNWYVDIWGTQEPLNPFYEKVANAVGETKKIQNFSQNIPIFKFSLNKLL